MFGRPSGQESIIVATNIWEDQEFSLSRSKELAKIYIEKLQRTMKSKLDKRVQEENRLKLDPTWTPGPDDDDWLEILHDGLSQNLPNELPEPIQISLRGEQLPPEDQQAEEAERIVNKLTEGKSVDYIQQLYNNMKGYRGSLSFFQLNPPGCNIHNIQEDNFFITSKDSICSCVQVVD